jgi:drug/metabolite transporter (DMT)-like permease
VVTAKRGTLTGATMVLLGSVASGTTAVFGKLTLEHGADVIGLASIRFGLGAACLLALRAVTGLTWPRISPGRLAVLTVLFMAQSFTFFEALNQTSAAVAVVLLYTYPLFVTLAAAPLLGEPITRWKLVLLLTGFVGVVLTVGGVSGGASVAGVALSLGSGVLFTAFLLVAKDTFNEGADPITVIALICIAMSICYGILFPITGASLPTDSDGWGSLAVLVMFGTFLGMALYFEGLTRLPASATSMLATVEPVVAVVFAAVILHEDLSALQTLGGVLVVGSVCALSVLLANEEPAAVEPAPGLPH